MTKTNKIVVLWLLILIGYILHPQYYLSGIFYGIDVKLKDAAGVEPSSSHIMHLLFDILPMVIIVLTLYLKNKLYKIILLIITILFLLANGAHFAETIKENAKNISQVALTFSLLIINLLLLIEVNKWRKENDEGSNIETKSINY